MNTLLKELIIENRIFDFNLDYLESSEDYLEINECKFECEKIFNALEQFDYITEAMFLIGSVENITDKNFLLKTMNILDNSLGLEPAIDLLNSDESFLKRQWRRIVAMIKALGKRVVEYYRKAFNNLGQVKKDMEKYLSLFKKLNREGAKSDKENITVNLKRLISKNQSGDKALIHLTDNLQNLSKEIRAFIVSAQVPAFLLKSGEDIKAAVDSGNADSSEDIKKIINLINVCKEDYLKFMATSGDTEIVKSIQDNDAIIKKSAILPGNKALYTKLKTKEILNGVKSVSSADYVYGQYSEDDDLTETNEIKINQLTFNSLIELAELGHTIVDLAEKYNVNKTIVISRKEMLIDIGNEMTNSGQLNVNIREYIRMLQWIANKLEFPAFHLISNIEETSRGILGVLKSVAKVYK